MALDPKIIERWHNSDLLLLGGSAGSFKPIYNAVKIFPANLNKAVMIIIHRKKNFFSEIEKLFADSSRMLLREVSDKDVINNNTIYIAPANYHTLIEKDRSFSLDVSDAVWYSKPSIDVAFESASDIYHERCTAVLFSGANPDGAAGLLKLRNNGALTIVQDPIEAEMSEMPQAAIDMKAAEYILTAKDILELFQL
ncbi:chemotaxis protein CheB [Mucilaginibacter sp. UR6-11]|uniref:chemotaxis protein CheB n=1 Tax=Mucilaginibacter sp. UR6-11 TaxID=1435644 RepID=UPI001E3113DE|nr:chemotaxis protein CheB [Mucilaginibacter sp. UR6-11]MCC8423340.1 chemotaxis protein CheB [Mucilaginibacter sp. UR6-11]